MIDLRISLRNQVRVVSMNLFDLIQFKMIIPRNMLHPTSSCAAWNALKALSNSSETSRFSAIARDKASRIAARWANFTAEDLR